MADPLRPNIVNVSQTSSLDAQGNVLPQVVVTYKVGMHGPFTAVFPAADFTAAAAQQVMNARASDINQLVGMA